MQFVLIDTWWNVNYNQIYFADKIARFNRYMVECEFDLICERSEPSWSFNRYMVECELYIAHGAAQSSQGFNRYMVECE